MGRRVCEACGNSGGLALMCTGSDYLLADREERFAALRCTSCGFAFLETLPEDPARHYPAPYFSSGGDVLPGLERMRRAVSRREARWLRHLVPQAKSILEVGPGRGEFLLALHHVFPGSEVNGFDITAGAALQRRLAPEVSVSYAPSLEDGRFKDGSFDLIVMRHVLEHVPDLAGFMREIRRICRPHGILYVKVPNRSSLAAHAFGRYWHGLDFPRHARYFSASDLRRILRSSGFDTVRTGQEADTVDWIGSLRFLCADRLRIPVRGGWLWEPLFLLVRALFLPASLVAQILRRSSRIWVLAQEASGKGADAS